MPKTRIDQDSHDDEEKTASNESSQGVTSNDSHDSEDSQEVTSDEEQKVSELLKLTQNYLLDLFQEVVFSPVRLTQDQKQTILKKELEENPLLNEKFKQCEALIKILKEDKPASQKLKAYKEKINEYKKSEEGLVQHRNPNFDKFENILRGFAALLATATVILAPVVIYKIYHGTLFKRTAGEQMIERSEEIHKRHKPK